MKRLFAGLTVVLLAVLGSPIAAASAPTGDQSFRDRMLSPADVPAALGVPSTEPTDSDVSGLSATSIPICSRQSGVDSAAVTVRAPGGFEAMVVTRMAGESTYREVDELVATYPSTAAATRAWRELRSKVRACDGERVVTNAGTTKDDGTITDRYASGASPTGALWISDSTRWATPDPMSNGSTTTTYTVFRQAGNVIVATWTYINGHARTTTAERRAVHDLSATLASRW